MDIYCTNCGEPWDFWEDDRAEILAGNCEACNGKPQPGGRSLKAQAMEMLADLGDIDGAAAEMEDLEAMGWFRD